MKILVGLLLLSGTLLGTVSAKRKIQCRLFQTGAEAAAQNQPVTPQPTVVVQNNGLNSTEFEMIMMKLDALDLRMVKAEFALHNTVESIATDVDNLGQVVEKLAWVASQTELSTNFVEHHVKLIEYNLTTLLKDVRDLLTIQQRLPTRTYIENALVKLKFHTVEPIAEPGKRLAAGTGNETIIPAAMVESMMMEEQLFEFCDQMPDNKDSGVYSVMPDGDFREPMKVYCNQSYQDGGWVVIQRRFNGTVNFYREYAEYARGFGKMDGGEFWLGLERIHRLTYAAPHELVVVLEDWEGESRYAKYENFEIAGEYEHFKVTKIDGYSGDAGDSFNYTLNATFTTFDQDHDSNERGNCAVKYHGAWWYKACHDSNLNGKYLRGNTTEFGSGMNWHTFHGMGYALKSSMMMIRRRQDLLAEGTLRLIHLIEDRHPSMHSDDDDLEDDPPGLVKGDDGSDSPLQDVVNDENNSIPE